jgi:hypothetical protein
VAVGRVANVTKAVAASINRMEINKVKINFPYTGHECRGLVEVLTHSYLTSPREVGQWLA